MTCSARTPEGASVDVPRASTARAIGTASNCGACSSRMTTMKLRSTVPRLRRHDVECTRVGAPKRSVERRRTRSIGSSSAPTSMYQAAGPHGPARCGVPASRRRTNTSAWIGPSVPQTASRPAALRRDAPSRGSALASPACCGCSGRAAGLGGRARQHRRGFRHRTRSEAPRSLERSELLPRRQMLDRLNSPETTSRPRRSSTTAVSTAAG
jgi:hypothetical protein